VQVFCSVPACSAENVQNVDGVQSITIPLDSKSTHHLINVTRLSEGDLVEVVDPISHKRFSGILKRDSRKSYWCVEINYQASIASQVKPNNQAAFIVTRLFVALCKGKINEFLIEKATELGCQTIITWHGDRSIPKISDSNIIHKESRWRSLASQAAKQSLQNKIPTAYFSPSLSNAIETYHPKDTILITCSLSPEAKSPIDLLRIIHNQEKIPVYGKEISLVIGPEGDFSPSEEKLLLNNGSRLLSLGDSRLRVDTATIFALGVLAGASQALTNNQT
jgi:16S rRNA (uracil1498-N3)-methyltransferase